MFFFSFFKPDGMLSCTKLVVICARCVIQMSYVKGNGHNTRKTLELWFSMSTNMKEAIEPFCPSVMTKFEIQYRFMYVMYDMMQSL